MTQEKNQDTVDPIYKKGFENGYWLAKAKNPQLDQFMKNKNADGKFLSGMKDGKKEVEREKIREEFKQMDAAKEKDKGKQNEKEI